MDLIERQTAISDFEWCKSQAIDKDKWQEAIDRIKALPSAEEESFEWCHDCKEYDKSAHCCHRWTKVIRNTVEEFKNEHRWIPVSERLPDEEDEKVLVTDEYGDIDIAWFEFNEWTDDPKIEWWNGEYKVQPTAWMPLPEPYKDGN